MNYYKLSTIFGRWWGRQCGLPCPWTTVIVGVGSPYTTLVCLLLRWLGTRNRTKSKDKLSKTIIDSGIGSIICCNTIVGNHPTKESLGPLLGLGSTHMASGVLGTQSDKIISPNSKFTRWGSTLKTRLILLKLYS